MLDFWQNIRKNSYLYPKKSKSIFFLSKISKKYHISNHNIWQVFHFVPKHSKSIKILSKTFEKYQNSMQNIWKVSALGRKHSKIIEFLRNTLHNFNANIRTHHLRKVSYKLYTKPPKLSGLDPKHLTSIWFWPKTFERYMI